MHRFLREKRACATVIVATIAACGGGSDGAPNGDLADAGAPREDSGADASVPDAGGDASHPDAGPVTGVDVSSDVAMLDQKLAAAICAKLAACCSSADAQAALAQYTDAPFVPSCNSPPCAPPVPLDGQCATVLAMRLHGLHDKWAASVKRGNMAFDAAKGAACAAAVSSAACGAAVASALFDGSCFSNRGNAIFTKIAPLGHACQPIQDGTFIGECDPALGFCDFKDSKTCVAWQKTGQDCEVVPKLELCAPDLSCDGASPNAPGKCSAAPIMVAAGASCDATSGPLQICPATQYCDAFGVGATGKCQPKKADGQSCATDDECATSRPYSCYPYGGGTCGSTAFCGGAVDGGAGDGGAGDGGAGDAGQARLTIERADDAAPVAAGQVSVGQRARVLLRWNAPGATSVALDGAGPLVAVVTDGVPTYDDLSGLSGTAPTQTGNTYSFRTILSSPLPAPVTILGDTWNRVAINPHGVLSRGAPSSLRLLDTTLPIPSRGGLPPDWSDGTIAPFLDNHLDARDGSSRIKTATLGSGNDQRLVVEWSEMTTTTDFQSNLPAHLTFQVAVYVDGRVEYRYKTVELDLGSARPDADRAVVQGQGASIGVASSDGTRAVPLSVRRASLKSGVTYTFTPSGALPPVGRALVVTPAATGVATYTLRAQGAPDATVTADVGAMYTQSSVVETNAPRDITQDPNVRIVPFGGDTLVPVALPFALDVFHEGWRSVGVSRTGAIAAWGASANQIGSGLNGHAIPSRVAPTGILAMYYPSGFSAPSWCTAVTPVSFAYLVEGTAPSRAITIQMKGVRKCSSPVGDIDLQATVHEGGDVEYRYSVLTTQDPNVTGGGVLVGLENGNGEVGLTFLQNQPAGIAANLHVTYTRHP